MGEHHLIIFGSDSNEDGAIMVAYNASLGVGSCRYPMKIYVDNAQLYCFNNRIILEAGNHIGMLPYALQVSRSLASLLASHELVEDDSTKFADWGFGEVSLSVSDDIKHLLNLGLTERAICMQIIPQFLERNDFKNLQKAMTQFKDVPEQMVVMLLEYIANNLKSQTVEMTDKDMFKQFEAVTNKSKLQFLNSIFKMPVSDAVIIPHLRNNLSLDNAVLLINYISYALLMPDLKFDVDFESKLFDWCTLLLDAFYQQYLMSKNENITQALENIQKVVRELIRQVEVTNDVLPLVNKLINKSTIEDETESLTYTIELMTI